MVKMKYLFAAALLVVLGIVLVTTVFPSEEKRVKKRFHLLSEWVSKSPEESSLAMLQKMRDIATLFLEPCELKSPHESLSGSYTPQEISAYAGSARSHFSQLNLKFYDLHVAFPEREVAKANLTARLVGRFKAGEGLDEVHELDCLLKKVDGKWRFSQIEVIEVLKK